MDNFDSSYFFDANDLFEGIPPPPPTASPTSPPPTSSPTEAPSVITDAPTTASLSVASSTTTSPSDQPSRITDQPSISPSKSQTVSTYDVNCEDEPGYKFKGRNACSWALKNLNRCGQQDDDGSYMLEHCRATCGKCQCQNDAFLYQGNTQWNCAW
eukprot:CAMPEP_0204641456 /NCGR_PEP_ID=MMETSP0717-20131115/51142_1 /ASSEMBLY_ACC=CAM_ASM_000666 /TAXON_ID=230516 /ORGANISM="Chaetoceros curvisetus" /LENGTH=155 /DNA_ID=CAMNT_0051662121 /DNA_START=167 /DNA_END=631 /DNA_ORIENTATION=-